MCLIRKISLESRFGICYIDTRKRESRKHTAYPQIITITVLHSRSLLAVVGGYFFPLKIS